MMDFRDLDWYWGSRLAVGAVRVYASTPNFPTSIYECANVYDYRGQKVLYGGQAGNPIASFDKWTKTTTSNIYIGIPDTLSGWGNPFKPTSAEIKAYFYGWKMCHSDGKSPYYKSEVPYNPETWDEWTISNDVTFDSTGATMTVYDTYCALGMPTALKTSTKYGVLIDVVTNELTAPVVTEGTSAFSAGLTVIETGVSGKVKAILTSLDTISSNRFVFKRSKIEASPKTLKIKDIRLYELPPGSQIEADFETLTADQLNEKYPFDGLNVKHWKKLVGTEAEIQNSITPALPTASYEGFTPYKMSYELAEPIEEQHDPVTLPTYYPTTVIEIDNHSPASVEEAEVKVKVQDVWEE